MRVTLFVVAFVLLVSPSTTLLAQTDLPDHSVYHLDSVWRDQTGATFELSELKGKVRLVAFVYTYCEHTCPAIVAMLKTVLEELPEQAHDQVAVTLVTLDPQRDTVERVNDYLVSRGLENNGWQMLVGNADDVLSLAALFDVRYKPMGESDIAHSNVISVVDQLGVVRGQLRGLGQDRTEFLGLLTDLTK